MKTISNQDSVSAFSITLENSDSASSKQFRIFDRDRVLNSINGSLSSATADVSVTVPAANVKYANVIIAAKD